MARYECAVCGYVFDEETENRSFAGLGQDWTCPICDSDKDLFEPAPETVEVSSDDSSAQRPATSTAAGDVTGYLSQWRRSADEQEPAMALLARMAETGASVIEPMRTNKPVVQWDEILIKGAQLATIPLDDDAPVNTQTVIGPGAKHPLVIETPIYISHMSFGALSKEAKLALAQGSAAAQTAMCSGEGGILDESLAAAHRYIFEYVPNQYSVTDENLNKVHAIEIKIGQSAKPGMGGHLPGEKVTADIAQVRGFPEGQDIISPSHYSDIRNADELKSKVAWLRQKSGGKPIGIKIAAGHIEADLAVALQAQPDFVTIDGRAGGTGAAPKLIKDATSVPTIFALHRARKFLDEAGATDVSLVITGGLRLSSDFAKALAMGADAVAIASAAMIALGCQQYRVCNTGKCPVGIATQDPELRSRLSVAISARRVENVLRVGTEELRTFARLTGHDDVHSLSVADLCTTNSEISGHTTIGHA